MDDKLYNLLIRSLDEELTASEQQQLAAGLASSKALRKEKKQLLAMRTMLGKVGKTAQFKPFFAEKVMATIQGKKQQLKEAQPDFFAPLLWSFQRVAYPSLAAICVLVAYTWFSEGMIDVDTLMGVQELADGNMDALYFYEL